MSRRDPLKKGDLVLRKMEDNEKGLIQGKLTSNWEDPYKIIEHMCPETLQLITLQGKGIP